MYQAPPTRIIYEKTPPFPSGNLLMITLIFTIFIGTVLSLLSVSFYNKYIKAGLIENADANPCIHG